jgi:AcrR family transcriptional regulator
MQPVSPRKSATTATAPAKKRSYDSSRRKRQAEQTRAEVLLAAVELFNTRGWADTTLADIADAAGVAVETIYNGFRSKKQLVRDAMDAAVVGDTEPIPWAERDEFRRMGVGTIGARLDVATDTVADIHERSAGVWQALTDAAGGDEELAEYVREGERRRNLDVARSVERIFGRRPPDATLDVLWILYGPETYSKLVHVLGRSRAQYRARLKHATLRLMGEPTA